MCGRYVIKFTYEEVRKQLKRLRPEERAIIELFNAAPSQSLPIVRPSRENPAEWEMVDAKWGLIPAWSQDEKPGPINARGETVATNGMFRTAFKQHGRGGRCIVPASGFYEWQEVMLQGKVPSYIYRADGAPLLMAGLWEKRDETRSFTIVTVAAGQSTLALHDRTPAILEPEEADAWLDPATTADQLQSMLDSVPDGLLDWHTVSTKVNSPRNQGAALIERAAD